MQAASQLVIRSSRHTVMSSHGQLVTSQLVTYTSPDTVNCHVTIKATAMPCSSVWLFGFNVTVSIARMISDNSYLWAWKLERNKTLHITCTTWQVIAACAILKSPTTAKLLNASNARSKSTVNSSQRRQTRRSTRHTILRCDELTVWRVDWFPLCNRPTVIGKSSQ